MLDPKYMSENAGRCPQRKVCDDSSLEEQTYFLQNGRKPASVQQHTPERKAWLALQTSNPASASPPTELDWNAAQPPSLNCAPNSPLCVLIAFLKRLQQPLAALSVVFSWPTQSLNMGRAEDGQSQVYNIVYYQLSVLCSLSALPCPLPARLCLGSHRTCNPWEFDGWPRGLDSFLVQ